MQWFFLRLSLFTPTQQKFLTTIVTQARFNNFSSEDQNLIVYLFSKLDAIKDDIESMNLVYDFMIRKFLYDETVKIFEVNQGENVGVIVEKNPGDGYNGTIVVREAKTKEELGSIASTSANIQTVQLTNLPLASCGFYKLQVCLEQPVGDATALLAYIYFMVGMDIDTPA